MGKVVPRAVVRAQVPNKISIRAGEIRKWEGKDQLINSDMQAPVVRGKYR